MTIYLHLKVCRRIKRQYMVSHKNNILHLDTRLMVWARCGRYYFRRFIKVIVFN